MVFSRSSIVAAALLFSATVGYSPAEVFLPGTQPEDGVEFGKVEQCKRCHAQTDNGNADPYFSWQGSMMAQAARDPVFRASLAIANQDIEGIGEFCLRCHSPRGWLENRSTPTDGSALTEEDMHGVSCDFCHHMVDPLSQEAKEMPGSIPPGYGNAMMVVDPENVVRGPYGDGTGAMPHGVMKSEYFATSNLCAVCHNVSNPNLAEDVRNQPPYAYGHVERTWSEWYLSDFPNRGAEGTCQSCHYPKVDDGGQASRFGDLHRDYFVMHGPVGGSTWAQDAIWETWSGQNLHRKALVFAQQRANELLKTAATLEIRFPKAGTARLRITNKTGHKLPTGYPEGRRMWVNVRFLNASGKVIEEIGRYGEKNDTVLGESIKAPTLLDPEATTVYECLPAISEAMAKKHDKESGVSFHFVLNDIIAKDNRIPPEGFTNEKFAEHLCEPVGKEYEDGQYWDDLDFQIPKGATEVQFRLMYQSVSWEYIKFLADKNTTDDWGRRLYEAWKKTGMCPPTEIAAASQAIETR